MISTRSPRNALKEGPASISDSLKGDIRAAAAGLVAALAFGFAFPDRPDYLGHFIAGFGATLGLCALAMLFGRPLGMWAVAIVILAVGFGTITEATIFRLAIFDPIDFGNQSLGAVLAGAATVGDRASKSSSALLLALGAASVVSGFYFAFA